MATRNHPWILALLVAICSSLSVSVHAGVRPISDAHRSAALDLFAPSDGPFGSLEETYEALRTFQILGIEKVADISRATCPVVVEKLGSSTSTEDLFHALRVNNILGCEIDAKIIEDVKSKLQAAVKGANALLGFYYSIGSLLLIKKQGSSVILSDADDVFHAIKAFSQSEEAGAMIPVVLNLALTLQEALETLAGVVSLAESEMDQSTIGIVKRDIEKLFDTIKSYNDGTFYFDEKHFDVKDYKGPLISTSSVVRGLTAFASVSSGKLNIPGDKILGLTKFFLSVGIPSSTKDLFNQIDSLSCLENNRQDSYSTYSFTSIHRVFINLEGPTQG
ncbi:dolichyl-diphosphooligosaccharide--protein glycosyltransferase subunit 2-like [Iris pallida]|uniref:Dolichyl-diphosphooligosaccharide--protein glycosyltransferase subunit 2 n=1 Tax=Iris pallida TaxID=29817 RepID=A0AAX6F4Y7_IRIPA|nr:dolichyl-diphosphooligosaccharide--protein glycosyltransferase subunit 2-like [Iris pallida]